MGNKLCENCNSQTNKIRLASIKYNDFIEKFTRVIDVNPVRRGRFNYRKIVGKTNDILNWLKGNL